MTIQRLTSSKSQWGWTPGRPSTSELSVHGAVCALAAPALAALPAVVALNAAVSLALGPQRQPSR